MRRARRRTLYTNTDKDWVWLQERAADAARWLGYVDFDAIEDRRNAAPVIRLVERGEPWAYLSVGADVEVPDAEELEPTICVAGFEPVQPYKLVVYGEKSSLEEVLAPICEQRHADLYLPTGEISDTLLHTMARVGAEDGRPMVVFTLSDCDPSGWQMPISIGRKLQAFKALEFPELEFQVRRVGLLPEHVAGFGLPSTPLKPSERRADRWNTAMGVEQTEVDALLALRPELLDKLVRLALLDDCFNHTTDAGRVGPVLADMSWEGVVISCGPSLSDLLLAGLNALSRAKDVCPSANSTPYRVSIEPILSVAR